MTETVSRSQKPVIVQGLQLYTIRADPLEPWTCSRLHALAEALTRCGPIRPPRRANTRALAGPAQGGPHLRLGLTSAMRWAVRGVRGAHLDAKSK